jgi:formylglycine-generating enzyme required for sulfatase activity
MRRTFSLGIALLPAALAQAQTASTPVKIDPAALVTEREGMVLVPAGEFKMGSDPSDKWAESDEGPQRIVNLPAFLIDQLEVSTLDYKRFIDATGWPAPPTWHDRTYKEGADFIPVTDVTWWDATAYAAWVGKRLPTEAEWEKAARGTDGRRFPWGNSFSADLANDGPTPLPVGSKSLGASPYGALDMSGNVGEWTASVYMPYPKLDAKLPAGFGGNDTAAAPPVSESEKAANLPEGYESKTRIAHDDPRLQRLTVRQLQDTRPRVYRGGSFNSYARFLRCTDRQSEGPGARWPNLGFRCAADIGSGQPPATGVPDSGAAASEGDKR